MTVGVGWGHCTSNLNDTDLNSSLLTSSFDINMLTCVVNRSIHWYKCTISPFHCSCSQPRNTYCHRNLHANVFSSADMDDTDDDDFMLIIVHFKSLYCRSSCRWSGLLGSISQRPSPWRQIGGTGTGVALVELISDVSRDWESNSLSSPRSLRQPSIWYFLPSTSAGGNCRPELQDTGDWWGSVLLQISDALSQVCAVWMTAASAFLLRLFASFSVWITWSHCSGCSEKISYKILNYHKFWSTSCWDCLFDILSWDYLVVLAL